HRHHVRRRRVRNTYVAAIVVCLAILAALQFVRKSSLASHDNQPTRVRTIPPDKVSPAPDLSVSQSRPVVAPKHAASNPSRPLTRAQFRARPSEEELRPSNELRVFRLELPVRSLRLVGLPVGEEVPDHRVLADFVVGPDRTPYAVRFVNYPVRRGE